MFEPVLIGIRILKKMAWFPC